MMTGRISSRQGLQVSAALGTKQLKKIKSKSPAKKIPVAPGSNKRGTAKGQGDGMRQTFFTSIMNDGQSFLLCPLCSISF